MKFLKKNHSQIFGTKKMLTVSKKAIIMLFTVLLTTISCSKDDDPVDNTSLPTLATLEITETAPTSAKSGGDITDTGGANITAKGVCWSTAVNPTIADNKTDQGTGSGVFTSSLSGLVANTTYYVRAYATNSKGMGYGDELSFIARREFTGETISIKGGSFQMGSNDGQNNEQPIHSITLSDFSMSKYEITNAQYATFMNAVGASSNGSVSGTEYLDMDDNDIQINYTNGQFVVHSGKENHPVIEVSWFGAKAYAEYYGGRLPTEAEWEYAAKGGAGSNGYTYSGSNTLSDVAWYDGNSGGSTHNVGTKNANELDIYDMSGNAREWVNDWYNNDYYSNSPSSNPQGFSTGTGRVNRGGSFNVAVFSSRVANRSSINPASTYLFLGFRPVFVP